MHLVVRTGAREENVLTVKREDEPQVTTDAHLPDAARVHLPEADPRVTLWVAKCAGQGDDDIECPMAGVIRQGSHVRQKTLREPDPHRVRRRRLAFDIAVTASSDELNHRMRPAARSASMLAQNRAA